MTTPSRFRWHSSSTFLTTSLPFGSYSCLSVPYLTTPFRSILLPLLLQHFGVLAADSTLPHTLLFELDKSEHGVDGLFSRNDDFTELWSYGSTVRSSLCGGQSLDSSLSTLLIGEGGILVDT